MPHWGQAKGILKCSLRYWDIIVSQLEVLLAPHISTSCLSPSDWHDWRPLVKSASSGTWQGTGGPFCNPVRSVEFPKGPAMALGGLREEMPPAMSAYPPWGHWHCGWGGRVVGSLWHLFQMGGSPLAPWTPAVMRSTSWLAGVPTKVISSFWSPLPPGLLHPSSQLPPSASSMSANKERQISQ